MQTVTGGSITDRWIGRFRGWENGMLDCDDGAGV